MHLSAPDMAKVWEVLHVGIKKLKYLSNSGFENIVEMRMVPEQGLVTGDW